MGRALRYVEMNRKSAHNPLRTGPTYQSPAAIWGTAFYDGTWNQPRPAPVPEQGVAPCNTLPVVLDPARELRNAEAAMRDAVRSYGFACKRLSDANRTRTPGLVKLGEVVIPSRPIRPEVVRQARSMAFRDLNQSRARMLAARRRLDAARLALGLPLSDADAKLAMSCAAGTA